MRGRMGERIDHERYLRQEAKKQGWTAEQADGLVALLLEHAGYLHSHGHSLAMAQHAFRQACLKVSPGTTPEFFAEVLNHGGSPTYGLGAAVEEARRFGVVVLPPCVNRSTERFVVEEDALPPIDVRVRPDVIVEGCSDAGATQTRARLEGSGPDAEWVVDGAKAFITNSGTDITSVVTVTARTGSTEDGRAEISAILVPSGTAGFTVEPAAFHGPSGRPCHRVWIEADGGFTTKSRPIFLN